MRNKQERCESILGKMNEREFGNMVELSKEITDFNIDMEEVHFSLTGESRSCLERS